MRAARVCVPHCVCVCVCVWHVRFYAQHSQATQHTNTHTHTRSYLEYYDPRDPSTHKGLDLRSMTMAQLYTYYNLDAQTVDFIGHALALHRCVWLCVAVCVCVCVCVAVRRAKSLRAAEPPLEAPAPPPPQKG